MKMSYMLLVVAIAVAIAGGLTTTLNAQEPKQKGAEKPAAKGYQLKRPAETSDVSGKKGGPNPKVEGKAIQFDELVEFVAAQDPAVVIAQREVELAQAKLQAVTFAAIEKVKAKNHSYESTKERLKSSEQLIQSMRAAVEMSERNAELMREKVANGNASQQEYLSAVVALSQVKEKMLTAQVAFNELKIEYTRLKAELDSYNTLATKQRESMSKWTTGFLLDPQVTSRVDYVPYNLNYKFSEFDVYHAKPGDEQSFPIRLSNVLKNKIHIESIPAEGLYPIEYAKKILESAGVQGMVKVSQELDHNLVKLSKMIVPDSTMSVESWLELLKDDVALANSQAFEILVRDYGLIITTRGAAPSDAIPISRLRTIDPGSKSQKKPEGK